MISGITKDASGAVCEAMVRAYSRDTGVLVGETVSNPSTGAYSITTADTSPHVVVRHVAPVVAGDPLWSSTVLAAHFDGSNGGTSFTDEKGHALTGYGSIALSDAHGGSGGVSLEVTSSATYVAAAASSDFVFGTGDFTIEARIFPTTINAYHGIVDVSSYGDGVLLRIQPNTLETYINGSQYTRAVTISTNAWHDIAICRAAGVCQFFFDGEPVGSSFTNTANLTTTGIIGIGSCNHSRGERLIGFIDEVRVTKAARYSGSYAPPARFLGGKSVGSPTENAQIFDNVIPL